MGMNKNVVIPDVNSTVIVFNARDFMRNILERQFKPRCPTAISIEATFLVTIICINVGLALQGVYRLIRFWL